MIFTFTFHNLNTAKIEVGRHRFVHCCDLDSGGFTRRSSTSTRLRVLPDAQRVMLTFSFKYYKGGTSQLHHLIDVRPRLAMAKDSTDHPARASARRNSKHQHHTRPVSVVTVGPRVKHQAYKQPCQS